MSKSKPKPLRSALAEVSAPEITVRARYRSAIGIDVHLGLLVCCFQRQDDNHREYQESRDFHTDRAGIEEFVAWCKECNPDIFDVSFTLRLGPPRPNAITADETNKTASEGTSSRKRFDNKFDSFAESEQPLSRVDFLPIR